MCYKKWEVVKRSLDLPYILDTINLYLQVHAMFTVLYLYLKTRCQQIYL